MQCRNERTHVLAMKLVIPDGIIYQDRPQVVDGKPVAYARVQYMGGEIRVANPGKFDGAFKDAEIECRLEDSVRTYTKKDTGAVGGFAAKEARFIRIVSAKVVKG